MRWTRHAKHSVLKIIAHLILCAVVDEWRLHLTANFFSIGSQHWVFALLLMFALNMMMDINELNLFHLTPMGDAVYFK